jgi:hypothetical protein
MHIIEITKANNESFRFEQIEKTLQWHVSVHTATKKEGIESFCLQLLHASHMRPSNNMVLKFSDQEVTLIIAYFKHHGFSVHRRDMELEKYVQEVVGLVAPDWVADISHALHSMNYHDTYVLAGQLAENLARVK